MSQDKRLDQDIDAERERLSDEVDGDPNDVEILGYATMYTVGDVLVPRDWLVNRARDLGIPDYVTPSEPRPSSAYKRAMGRLIEDTNGDGSERRHIVAPRLDDPEQMRAHKVDLSVKEGDGKVRHLYVEVFFPEEESKQEGGKWDKHHLGQFDYNADAQRPTAIKDDDLDEGQLLFPLWEEFRERAYDLFDMMKVHYNGHDVRQMMYYSTRDYTNSVVKLRRSVYLFPAGLSEFVKNMQTLYDEINTEFKTKGDPVAVRTIPVLNTDDKKEWVEHAVQQAMTETVDKALEEAWEQFADDSTADEVVKTIKENLLDGEETAEVYNSLLEAQLDVEEMLKERREELANEDREDIVDRVLSQTDFDQF